MALLPQLGQLDICSNVSKAWGKQNLENTSAFQINRTGRNFSGVTYLGNPVLGGAGGQKSSGKKPERSGQPPTVSSLVCHELTNMRWQKTDQNNIMRRSDEQSWSIFIHVCACMCARMCVSAVLWSGAELSSGQQWSWCSHMEMAVGESDSWGSVSELLTPV